MPARSRAPDPWPWLQAAAGCGSPLAPARSRGPDGAWLEDHGAAGAAEADADRRGLKEDGGGPAAARALLLMAPRSVFSSAVQSNAISGYVFSSRARTSSSNGGGPTRSGAGRRQQ
jgi:hypothetical protein